MRCFLLVAAMPLLISACAASATVSPSPTPTVATTPHPIASVEQVSTAYLRALFAKNFDAMQALFPTSKPEQEREEYMVTLKGLQVRAITPEEAGDRSPGTRVEYARAEAMVEANGRTGHFRFLIGTVVSNGVRVVNMVSRTYDGH